MGSRAASTTRPRRPRPRRTPDIGWVCGGLAALIGFARVLSPLSDNSFFTHLATGRLIIADGRVPTADPYSFTAHGEPWTVQSWLAALIYAGVEDVAGLGAVRFVNAILCAAIGVGVWHLTARSRSLAVRAGVTLSTLLILGALVSGRPLLFGLLGFVLTFLAADGRLDPRWLLPVGWVWVNTHGSFPFALLLVAVLAVGHRLDAGGWGREPRRAGLVGRGHRPRRPEPASGRGCCSSRSRSCRRPTRSGPSSSGGRRPTSCGTPTPCWPCCWWRCWPCRGVRRGATGRCSSCSPGWG